MTAGRVALVGAGPGSPDLLSVRGRDLLATADVVVIDRLVGPEIRASIGGATVIEVGKTPRGPETPQTAINDILLDQARLGRTVVRLKGGDPFVFGRGAEELQACRAAGIEVEIVPGVSSALAAPALAGIGVTAIGVSAGFTVVSGHLAPSDPSSLPAWPELARLVAGGHTLVLLMAMRHLAEITDTLQEHGADPTTPALIVQDASLPTQREGRAPLSDLAVLARDEGLSSPAVVVIGASIGPGEPSARTRMLVLGGARSGKSAFAESLLAGHDAVHYIATSRRDPDDEEWARRIEAHRQRRPEAWLTVEATGLVAPFTERSAPPALVDSITGWLVGVLDEAGAWRQSPGWRAAVDAAIEELVVAWSAATRQLVLVSDEVGAGIVPETASGRLFRDELGRVNQRLAAAADQVWLVTAGLPRRLK